MNFSNQFIGKELFPNKTDVNSANNLSINGFDLTKLAEKYQTPLYVYDEDTIISTIKDFQNSFKSELDTSIISYSTKAFSNPYLLKLLNENDMNNIL